MENFISRPFHCSESHEGKTHKAVWGTSSQTFRITKIVRRIREGITPHIISWRAKNGHVETTLTCGVIGCGCDYKDGKLVIKKVAKKNFSLKAWNAIVRFKNTGLEI